jgi:hypothetical protein
MSVAITDQLRVEEDALGTLKFRPSICGAHRPSGPT